MNFCRHYRFIIQPLLLHAFLIDTDARANSMVYFIGLQWKDSSSTMELEQR